MATLYPGNLSIGELARSVGVTTSTVRFYERRGLLKPEARTQSNYRSYSSRSAERLKFIRAAQAGGFTLKDIREMLALTYSDEPPCAEVAALIEQRLIDVKQRPARVEARAADAEHVAEILLQRRAGLVQPDRAIEGQTLSGLRLFRPMHGTRLTLHHGSSRRVVMKVRNPPSRDVGRAWIEP